MIAKRFTINNEMTFNDKIETYELNCISDNENKTFYFIADSIENVQLFIKRLNELHEENQYLKSLKRNQDCINEISISMQQIQLLEKENEQLKQQLIEKEKMLDVRDKIIADVMKAVNGDVE